MTTCSTPGSPAEAAARRGQRVVGLELHHRPDDHAQRRDGVLGERELGQQLRVDALAGLVAGEELVAERLDDVVEGARHVRHAGRREQQPEAAQQADGRADLAAVGRLARRRAEVAAKQLVGPVDEVDLHRASGRGATGRAPNLRTARSCARAALASRSFGAAVVTSEPSSVADARATSSTAQSNAS